MVRIYSLLMIVCCFCSCQESDKERFTRLVKEWERKQIHFPDHSVFTVQGKDTVDFNFKDADYKVVTYVDSAGCTGCKLQLHRWKELMAEVDSLTDGKVPFLFLLSSQGYQRGAISYQKRWLYLSGLFRWKGRF